MDAGKLWMLQDFIGTNKVLFRIPVYQRNYDWSDVNCNKLLDDIKQIIDTGEKHFLGTFVYMPIGGGFSLKEYIIIDGQQRLTTMMILLKALSDLAQKNGDGCYEEIEEIYLHNRHCEEQFKIKLKPVKSDNEQFLALLKNNTDALDEEGHIFINYEICRKRLEKWIASGITPSEIHTALEKLEIVEISLTKGEDDPQVIFESINSTGLELSCADLIRNFLLMNADKQEELYEKYWLSIEKALKSGTDYTNLNLFFMQYVIYKTSAPVNLGSLYQKFVKLFKDGGYTQESCLKELKYHADIFRAFVFECSDYPAPIRKILKNLRQLKQTTSYPFLIHVFDDYKQGTINEDTLRQTLELILSYLVRRSVCGIPSNSLRGLFIYLYNRVFKVSANKKKYYQAINKFLFTMTSKDAMPSTTDFERALKTNNLYGNLSLCKFLLMEIENGNGKETLNTETLTIEHIMPQALSSDWKHISDQDHEQYLHTLGNLSVSGYNSELSNKSFSEKKKIIAENSKAVILNSDVLSKDSWNIDSIKSRSGRLAQILMQKYDIERVTDDSIEFDVVNTITLNDYSDVTGKKLVTFKFDREIYRQNKYALMLLEMVRILDQRHPGVLEQLARQNFSLNPRCKRCYLSCKRDNMCSPYEIEQKPGIFIELNLSSQNVMSFIDKLLEQYGEDKSSFSINVIAEETDDADTEE